MAQANTVAAPQRWPLAYQPGNRLGATSKDAKIVNGLAEYQTDTGLWTIAKRAGYSSASALTAGAFGGGFSYNTSYLSTGSLRPYTDFIFPLGTTLYSVAAGFTSIGTLPNSGDYHFDITSGSTPYVVMNAGWRLLSASNRFAYFQPGVSALATATTSFPDNTVPGVAVLDGTTYVMDAAGGIWGSKSLNDPTVWDPLNVIYANAVSGAGVTIFRHLSYILALKAWSTHVFYDAGNASGSPLAPVSQAVIPFGCVDPASVVSLDGITFWATASREGRFNIVQLAALSPSIISTPRVERLLTADGAGYGFRAFVIKTMGHRLVCFRLQTLGITLAYDLDQNFWHEWTDTTGAACWPIAGTGYYGGTRYGVDNSSGGVYALDDSLFSDNTAAFDTTIITPRYDAGVNRSKNLEMLAFNTDMITGSLYVSCSDDDYQTFDTERAVDLNDPAPQLPNEGSFYRRAYKFRCPATTAFRISSVDAQVDIGTL